MKKIILIIVAILMYVTASYAGDINASDIDTSAELSDITKEVGHAISIPAMEGADPLGLLIGINVAVEASSYKVEEAGDLLDDENILMLRAHVQKGLPFGIDIGAEYMKDYNSNIEAMGGEVRWAIIEDGIATPAVGLRGTYSALTSVDKLSIKTYGGYAQVSKSVIKILTPYAGVGYLISYGDVEDSGLDTARQENKEFFAGVKLNILLLKVTAQADVTNDNNMYTLKVGLGF